MFPDKQLHNDKGTNIPITESGVTTIYTTNAPHEIISKGYAETIDTLQFTMFIEKQGYRINRFKSVYELNFDKKKASV